jgi:hypothetical protein
MTSTPAAKRELSLANTVGEFDAGDRDGGIGERLEACHRCASPLDRTMVLLDEVVEVTICANRYVAPTRMLASKQPQRATVRDMTVQRNLPRNSWGD